MLPITEETAKNVLESYVPKIRQAIGDAIRTYYTGPEYASLRHQHTPRTDANICHDLIVANIEREFNGVAGVQCCRRRGLFLLVIHGLVVLRFKKFNRKLMSSNIATSQSQLLLLQDTGVLELPEMPPNGLLHVGYVMGGLNTTLSGVYVTCRYDSVNIWDWDISQPEVVNSPTYEFVPQRERKRKVTAKTTEKKADSGGEK